MSIIPYIENQYLISSGVILVTLILTVFVKRILMLVGKATARSKTKIDDILIEHIKLPLQILILTIGLFIAIKITDLDFAFGAITLTQIFSALWVFAVAYLISRIVKALFAWYTEELKHNMKRKIDETLFIFVRRVINATIYIIAPGVLLRQFGIEITAILAGLGIAGLAIGLALKDTLANFFSALYITIDRPMRIGDFIELNAETKGQVKDIGWRTTRLKTWDGNYLVVPNAKIAESVLRNYNVPRNELTVPVNCGVSYNSDLEKVEKIVLRVAKKIQKMEEAVNDFEPSIRFKEFGDSSINFTAYLKVKNRESKFKVTHQFIINLKKAFDKERIEIPFPQRVIHKGK